MKLRPQYEEREKPKSNLAELPAGLEELAAKEKLLPKEAEQEKWTQAEHVVD